MNPLPRVFLIAALLLFAAARPLLADETPAKKDQGYTVLLDIKVNEDGTPSNIALVKSQDVSAGEVLDKMAIAMALKTKFPPRLKEGHPVKYTARAPFFFPIEGDEGPDADLAPKPKPKMNNRAIQPAYPVSLEQRGEAGGAILELIVDADGKIAKLTTLRASHPEVEAAAVQAVKQWEFVPAMKDGKPVESRCRLAIVFESQDHMADLKWRIAPRPSLGSFIVIHDTRPVPASAPASPSTAPTPAPETPAK